MLSTSALLIYTVVGFTAWFSGIFGMGGGIILLALMTLFVPAGDLVPLHGLLVLTSIGTRGVINWKHIQWHLVWQCSIGLVFGVVLGASIGVSLPESVFFILLGMVLTFVVWSPKNKKTKLPLLPAGFLHGIVSSMFGTGGVLQAIFSRLHLTRHQLIATFAAVMCMLNIGKLAAFSFYGFGLLAYMPVFVISIIPALIGSYLGKLCLDCISEDTFRLIFKGIITLLALRLIVVGLWQLF